MASKLSFLFEAVSTAAVSLLRMVGSAAAFAFSALVSSALGPEGAGTFFVSITWAFGLAIVARWGSSDLILLTLSPLAQGWRREAVPAMLARYILRSLLRMLVLVLPGLLAIVWLASSGIAPSLAIDPVFVFFLALAIVVQQQMSAAAKAFGRPVLASALEFCFITLFSIAGYFVFRSVMATAPMRGFELLYLAGAVISTLILLFQGANWVSWLRPLRTAAMQTTMRRSHSFAIIELCGYLSVSSSLLLMPFFLSAADVGIFNAALRIASLVTLVSVSIPSVFVPRLAVAYRLGDMAEARRLVLSMKLVMLVAAIGFFLGVAIFGRMALALFGAQFAAAYVPLLVTAAGLCGALALGSGLIDHNQKMTVAAIAMADMKVWAQRSYRV